jgi:hypothetical protein
MTSLFGALGATASLLTTVAVFVYIWDRVEGKR